MLLDAHNEYVEIANDVGAEVYDASFSGVNIFDLEGLSERERTSEITGMLKRVFRLGEVQSYVLYKCIAYTYRILQSKGRVPNIHDLLYCIKVFKRHASGSESNILEALEKRLLLIDTGTFTQSTSVSKLITNRSIFALSSLHTNEAQSVYMEGLLKKLYTKMLSMNKTDRVRFYIIIDEAEKLGESSIIRRLIAEGRKYGIGIIAISQRAKALDKEIRSNASLFVAFSQHEPEESNYISNFISNGNELNRFIEVKKAIRNLRKGSAVVLDSRYRNPKLVRFDLFKPGSRDPSYDVLELARKGIIKKELFETLSRRGFDAHEIADAVSRLIRRGTIRYHVITEGRYEGVWYITMPRNSAEHDVCVNLISKHLSVCGVNNVVYNNSYGPDITAFNNGESTAIEYETGFNDIERTRKMLETRMKRYRDIVVVVNDKCYEKYRLLNGIKLFRISEFLQTPPKMNKEVAQA
jgi:hypothetical protein